MTGEQFYEIYRREKGGVTRTGAVMATWAEMKPGFRAGYDAAAQAAQQGMQPAQVYAAYLAARDGKAWDGSPAPDWTGLADRHAWTAAAEGCR